MVRIWLSRQKCRVEGLDWLATWSRRAFWKSESLMSGQRAYILCQFAAFSGLYTSWLDALDLPYEIVEGSAAGWVPPDDAGIVITHMHYRWEEVHALRRVLEGNRVPILILADGILEYRNLYEHPDLADGCIFQPVLGHKLACLGRAQARIVESWGNVGRCEVVGLPRLDEIAANSPAPIQRSGPFRLLIATASTPAFNQAQRETVLESLAHFKQRVEANGRVNGRPLEVTWRLTGGLDRELGISSGEAGESRPALSSAIDQADAVITTPSTLYLESVLKRRPTAILDFYNSPHFVSAAWTINAPKHFNAILHELSDPPQAKLLFQQTELHNQLECGTAAKPRLLALIREMVAAGAAARASGRPLELPPRILHDSSAAPTATPSSFDLARLYPTNPVFTNRDIASLQVELNLAVQRLGSMPAELAELQTRVADLRQQLDQANSRNRSLKDRLLQVRELYQQLRAALRARREHRSSRPLRPSAGAAYQKTPAGPTATNVVPVTPDQDPPPTVQTHASP